ncbi:HlpA protein [Synergistales bacterium]|nr:HlpA protein [Synergistales bacterium]
MRDIKKFVVCLLAAVMLAAFGGAAFAAAASEEKVGEIDPQKILFQHPKYEQTLKQIKSIADKKQADAKTAIDKESDNNKKAELFQKMRSEVAAEEQKLMQPIFKDIDLAVRKVAGAKRITVVIDKGAVFFGGLDITDDVVQELKKESAGGK